MKLSIAILTIFLEILFTYDNIKDSLNINPKETLKMLFPVATIIVISFFSAYLPSFTRETIVVYFQYQMVFAIIILKLMLHNMCGRPFSLFHSEYYYLIMPMITYHYFGISAELEVMITRWCAFLAFAEFFYSIYKISI